MFVLLHCVDFLDTELYLLIWKTLFSSSSPLCLPLGLWFGSVVVPTAADLLATCFAHIRPYSLLGLCQLTWSFDSSGLSHPSFLFLCQRHDTYRQNMKGSHLLWLRNTDVHWGPLAFEGQMQFTWTFFPLAEGCSQSLWGWEWGGGRGLLDECNEMGICPSLALFICFYWVHPICWIVSASAPWACCSFSLSYYSMLETSGMLFLPRILSP